MPSKLNTKEFQVVFPMIPGLATRKDDLLIDSHDLLFRLMFLCMSKVSGAPAPKKPMFLGELEWCGSQICGSNLKFGTHLLHPVG